MLKYDHLQVHAVRVDQRLLVHGRNDLSDDLFGAAVDGGRHGRDVFRRRNRHDVEARADVGRAVGAQDAPEMKLVFGLGWRACDRVEDAVIGPDPGSRILQLLKEYFYVELSY